MRGLVTSKPCLLPPPQARGTLTPSAQSQVTKPWACLACACWRHPSPQVCCLSLHSPSENFLRNDGLKKSAHIIHYSEPSLASAKNQNSLPPLVSSHPRHPPTSNPLNFLFLLLGIFFPDCPMTGSFLSFGTFSVGASGGDLPRPPRLQTPHQAQLPLPCITPLCPQPYYQCTADARRLLSVPSPETPS